MPESHHLALFQEVSTLNLLESLGFIVNYKKSHSDPVQQLRVFRGPSGHQRPFPSLARRKLRKILKKCQNILDLSEISVRELSKFLSLLTSSIQAIFPAPPAFQTPGEPKKQKYGLLPFLRGSNTTRSSLQRGDSVVERPPSSMEWKGPSSEASRAHHRDRYISKRMGAYCQGISTGGPWCLEEKRLHINCLELLAGSSAIKTFTKRKACAHVKLLMDNAAAVAYIN